METFALTVAGLLAPFITNWIKSWTGWKKQGAMILTVLVSFLIAVLAVVVSGGTLTWKDPGTVLAIATVVYHFFMKD